MNECINSQKQNLTVEGVLDVVALPVGFVIKAIISIPHSLVGHLQAGFLPCTTLLQHHKSQAEGPCLILQDGDMDSRMTEVTCSFPASHCGQADGLV